MSIAIFMNDGYEESEALITVDLLRRAGLEIDMVSMNGKKEVVSSHKVAISADVIFDNNFDADKYEAFVLPGGKPGVIKLKEDKKLGELLIKHTNEGKLMCAICAGPSVLGELGLLKDKDYVCYPGFESDTFGGKYHEDQKVIQDGNIITGKAMGATVEFSHAIITALASVEQADKVVREVYY